MQSKELRKPVNQPPAYAFDIFLSYSRKDRDFAVRLENALESYRFPKSLKNVKRNLNVFRDESDIYAAEDYHRTIEQHLAGSAKLVVVCSPDARKSKYVEDEIRRFIETHGEQDIIPVLFRGKANNETTDENQKAFPEVMCENRMPLAANFLGCDTHKGNLHKGPFQSSFYSVLAAINGIDRRRLEQIDEKVRTRRRALVLSTASGIILILSVALVFAVISQRKAVAASIAAMNSARAEENAKNAALAAGKAEKAAKDEAIKAKDAAVASAKAEAKAKDEALAAAEAEKKATEKALAAAKAEERAKNEAIAQKKAAEQLLYTADVNLAPQVYATGNAQRSIELLDDLLPPKREDLRGFPWYYLNGLYHRELGGFETLTRGADYSTFSPDGNLLATATAGTIRLWDVTSRKLLREFKSDDAGVSGAPRSPNAEEYSSTLTFSPDNRVLAIALANGSTKVWDTVTQRLTMLDPPVEGSPVMAFAPNGLLATGVNQTYKLWEATAHKLITKFEAEKSPGDAPTYPSDSAVVFSHDSRFIAYLQGTVIKVRDLASAEVIKSVDIGALSVRAIAFSADDKMFRVGSTEGVDSFSLKDKTSDSLRVPMGSVVWINGQPSVIVAFSPDGRICATGEETKAEFGGGVKLWDISSHELLVSFGGSTSNGEVTSLTFSPDGKTLGVGGTGSFQFYDARVQRNSAIVQKGSSTTFAAFSSDGKRFAVTQATKASNEVMLRNTASTESPAMKPLRIGKRSVIALSPNGETMAVTNESLVELWDVATQRVIATANPDQVRPTVERPQRERRGQNAEKRITKPTGLAFSPDGQVLAIGVNGGIQWWVITSSGLAPQPGYQDAEGETIFGLQFSADGKLLAGLSVESSEGVVSFRSWDATSRRELGALWFAGGAQPTVMAFSADSKNIAVGFDNAVRESNAVIAGKRGFSRYMEAQVWDIGFLAGLKSEKIQWWQASDEDFRKRFLKATLEGGSVTVSAVAWSSDNRTLATGGTDGTVRLWNRDDYQRLLELPGQVAEIQALAFSPNNETLLAGGEDGIQLWYAPRASDKSAFFVNKTNATRAVGSQLSRLVRPSSPWPDLVRLSSRVSGSLSHQAK